MRRFRAERLLRREFHERRATVLARVHERLAARDLHLDACDLQSCYAQAWHGLYATVLAGGEVANPTGWLVTVTFRRGLEECRGADARDVAALDDDPRAEEDPDRRLDDLARLRELFEGMRTRLSARECEAATLCYLQGLSRDEAADRMGVSSRRMDKLMDGVRGAPGVSAKLGELLALVRGGRWCEEQASLMRALALGLLDPAGERYRVAVVHQRECPACRAYVASLRGLAAVLPPLPLGALAAGGATVAAGGAAATGSGGWVLAGGSLSAKVAASCLIVLGVGCAALVVPRPAGHVRHDAVVPGPAPARRSARPAAAAAATDASVAPAHDVVVAGVHTTATVASAPRERTREGTRPRLAATREFGVERARRSPSPAPAAAAAVAHVASAAPPPAAPAAASPAGATRAEREFGVQ